MSDDTANKPPVNPIEPDAALLLERLALEFADKPELADQARKLDWMIDILILRGHLTENHRGMIKRIRATRRDLIVLSSDPGTVLPVIDVDCASLMHLCHGRCCSFTVGLSEQEVKGGKVEWDLMKPYTLKKDQHTGYCQNVARNGRKKFATSRASAAGCSAAAKWPPLVITVHWRMSV